jgi:predicted protein tyrosine phosphatase
MENDDLHDYVQRFKVVRPEDPQPHLQAIGDSYHSRRG